MPEASLDKVLVEPLTRRELEILQLLLEDLNTNQIAEKLTLALSSVKWYGKQIYAKLGVNERGQLAPRAAELGLFPAETTSSAPRHNLPSNVTPFIGRQAQIETVRKMVTDPTCRLVTLTGAGGVGKTRLALKIAETSLYAFKHGVWLVELASVNEETLVDQTIVAVFGLQGDPSRTNVDLLRDYLREKRLLLVLDNCEQLIDACARLVEALLRACPDLHILVTSREALDIEGENPYPVPSLTFPDPRRLPEVDSLPQYEAVKLFVERARSFHPSFTLTESNARDVARICKRLDGIPLALELVAARVKVLGVNQIATELEESFNVVAGGFRTALPRHQTMRASIEWSYKLLSEPERMVFRRFAVFSGGWTLAEAKEVCADSKVTNYAVIDLLAQLVNKSLVTVETVVTPASGPEGDIRYYLMDAIWDFAREKLLETGEEPLVYDRHLTYFLALAENASQKLRGPDQVRWLDRLSHELPNLRAALDWGWKTNPIAQLRLASAITLFWHIRGQASEGLSWLSRGLQLLPTAGAEIDLAAPTQVQAQALTASGFLWMMSGEYRRAAALLEQALAIYRVNEGAPSNALAYPLLYLAMCVTVLGNYSRSAEYATESLARFRSSGDQYGVSECLLAQGNNESEPGRAKGLFMEALEIKRRIGDANGLAYTLQTLCEITVRETDFAQTQAWLEECLVIYQKVGNRKAVVNCLYSQAWVAWVAGEYQVALARVREAIALSQEIEEKYLVAKSLLLRCDIYLAQGDIEAVRLDIEAAEKIGVDLDDPTITAAALMKKGRLALIRGQAESALPLLQEALALSREEEDQSITGFSLYYLGRAALARKDLETARTCFEDSRKSFYEMNFWDWDYMAYPIEGLASIALWEGRCDEADNLFHESGRLFQGLDHTLSPDERKERQASRLEAGRR